MLVQRRLLLDCGTKKSRDDEVVAQNGMNLADMASMGTCVEGVSNGTTGFLITSDRIGRGFFSKLGAYSLKQDDSR